MKVSCEGYDHTGDIYVLAGSCGVIYIYFDFKFGSFII
jgi:hypothetical protein